jgi:AcrR family transcriptional regulator
LGISASSFYNSFGSKEELYCEATQSYLDSSGRWFFGILNDESTDTWTAFSRLFAATAEEFTRGDHPAGCMISLACTHTPPALTSIREMMIELRAFSEGAMAERLRKGIADGDVPADTDVDMLAAYFSAVARGLAGQARDGGSREKLTEIGRLANARVAGGQGGETIKVGEIKGRAWYDANCRATVVLIWLRSWIGEAYRGVAGAWYIRKGWGRSADDYRHCSLRPAAIDWS